MTEISSRQLPLFIIVYVRFLLPIPIVNAFDYDKQILDTRINQKILLGPSPINTYPGETIQFPCIVSKESDAIVTWCWNDFCTLGKAHLLRHQTTPNDLISIYQYTAYPRFHLFINERLNHYNLSISHVSSEDEGVFQCQVQRTMRANEARSERVQLTLIVPPIGQPRLLLPAMPLRQGQSVNLTCLSSPSKPASNLILYKNEQIITENLRILYELDVKTNQNLTKAVYTMHEPDSSWNNAMMRCEQNYKFARSVDRVVTGKIEVYYKPKVRIESQNRSPLIINSTATFRCLIHGNPPPSFRWFAHSIDLTSVTNPIINIPLSKHVHNHSIGCTARNSLGTTNTSIRLLIRYPPIFILRPPKLVVLDFDRQSSVNPMIVRCVVDSYPRARITWYRYGEIIQEGSLFNLENITKRDEQGIYSYRIETDGFETIKQDFIIYMKGKPLIYIQEMNKYNRIFQCQIYSSTPILKISWRLNDQPIKSSDQISITTTCDHHSCISKLIYDYPKLLSSSPTLNHLSCIAENQYGIEQSRLYQLNTSDDPSMILIFIIFTTFILIILFSFIALYCCCRIRQIRKRHERLNSKKLPIVYDEHYSINELIKEVGSLKTCNTSLKIESTDRLLTTLFNNNTKKLLDNLSNQSSINSSSGFHSKSTTTIFNNDYSPKLDEGLSPPLYINLHQRSV